MTFIEEGIMPEFKNREEYEKWKAERINKRQINNTEVEKPHQKNRRNLIVLATSILSLSILISGSIYLHKNTEEEQNPKVTANNIAKPNNIQQATDAKENKLPDEPPLKNQAYLDDATKTLAELEKLSSFLTIGISYDDYIRKLGEVNYPVSVFLRKYEGSSESSGAVYRVIKFGLDAYRGLSQRWEISKNIAVKTSANELSGPHRAIIETSGNYFVNKTDEHIKRGWGIIANLFNVTRRGIEEKNEEKKKIYLQEIARVFQEWDAEEANYQKQVASYKASLDVVTNSLKDTQKLKKELTEACIRGNTDACGKLEILEDITR